MTTILVAFHGKQKVKDKYLKRVRNHKKLDQIIKGVYWEKGKGCAVGCTVHSADHADYEKELGIPRLLARLEDGVFENLPNDRAKEWPEQFLEAIPTGADLSNIWPQFAVWLLSDEQWGVLQFAKTERSREAILAVAKFYTEGKYAKPKHYEEIRKIRASAYAAAYASAYADAAADAAAYAASAYASADADAAAYAASADAYAADAYAAYAAAYAASAYASASASAYADAAASADADAAAYAAAYAASYARDDARSKWRTAQADKLIELLKAALKVVGG